MVGSGMENEDENSYAGRWVARLRGRIIAQGGTPEQARLAAQLRYKEMSEIVFLPPQPALEFPPILDTIRKSFKDGQTAYLVGGAVRDAFLDRQIHDLDFVLPDEAIKTARRLADALKAAFFTLDAERDTGRVIVTEADGTRMILDFASYRGTDLESDLRGRDFTLNAIAYNLSGDTIHDPLSGMQDLKAKVLRACSPRSFNDDPVRILRGIRLAANYGLTMTPETRKGMKAGSSLLDEVSPERLRDELLHTLEGMRPAACLRALDKVGALIKVLPELEALKGVKQTAPHVHDVWEHTLGVVSHLEYILAAMEPGYPSENGGDLQGGLLVGKLGAYRQRIRDSLNASLTDPRSLRSLLFMAALYHDVAKPTSRVLDEEGQLRFWDHDQQGAEVVARRARALAMSNSEISRLEVIVRNHMRVLFLANRLVREGKSPSRGAIYRFFRDTGPAGVDVCLLALADMRATYEQTLPVENYTAMLDVARLLFENWFDKREESISPPPLVNGEDIMKKFNLAPGKVIGEILEAIRAAQAMGEISTSEQAIALAGKWFENQGLQRGIDLKRDKSS
jgi:tRNA nucleotidyltransferase/poly(A) polymerase